MHLLINIIISTNLKNPDILILVPFCLIEREADHRDAIAVVLAFVVDV